MKKTLSKWLKIIIPLALGVFLVLYVYNKFTEEQLQEVKQYFAGAHYGYLFCSLAFAFLSHLSRAYRWHYMLEAMGYKPKTANNVMSVFIGYLMNLGIPRSGEVSRAVILQKYENVPFQKAMGTIVTERIIDFIILNLFVLSVVLLEFDRLKKFVAEHIPISSLLLYALVFVVVLAVGLLILAKSKSPLVTKIKHFFSGFREGIMSLFKIKHLALFFLHTVFIWVMYVLMYYIAIFAVDDTADISFRAVLSSFVVGALAVTFTNGGFGAYPFLISEILLLYGVPETAGTAFGWIVWASQFLFFLVFGGLSFLLLPVYNRKRLG